MRRLSEKELESEDYPLELDPTDPWDDPEGILEHFKFVNAWTKERKEIEAANRDLKTPQCSIQPQCGS